VLRAVRSFLLICKSGRDDADTAKIMLALAKSQKEATGIVKLILEGVDTKTDIASIGSIIEARANIRNTALDEDVRTICWLAAMKKVLITIPLTEKRFPRNESDEGTIYG